eukprot:3485243-Alexandrium_andersonii.AAC.1
MDTRRFASDSSPEGPTGPAAKSHLSTLEPSAWKARASVSRCVSAYSKTGRRSSPAGLSGLKRRS